MAARGMPSYLAVSGAWTRVKPPAAWIARSPATPSEPVPDRTMPMADSPSSAAREMRNWLIEGLGTTSGGAVTRCRRPSLSRAL